MKKIKLNSQKLILKKEKIASLTDTHSEQALGWQPLTTATIKTCCLPPTYICI